MSSNSVFTRREARRRKILENSENRLRSITGGSCNIKSNKGNGLVEGNECTTPNEDLFMAKTQLEEDHISYKSPSELKFEELTSSGNSKYRHLQTNTDYANESEKSDNVSPINIFSSNKKRQFLFVSVAIVLRILIEINCSYIFVNSLVGAFILTKVGVTSICGWQIPDTSRLIGSFLLIGGISSQKTNLFVLASSIFINLVKDFSLLIFGFVFSELFVNFLRHLK